MSSKTASAARVLIVGYPGAELLDIACPSDVFDAANRLGVARRYELTLAGPTPWVRCQNGFRLAAERLDNVRGPLDTLIVAGGIGHEAAAKDRRLLDQVRRLAATSRRVSSVCTGASVLAAAGLLRGRRATTHWAYCDRLASSYPEVSVDPAPLYIQDGSIYTSAGVISGLDLALRFIDDDHGPTMARTVARVLVTYLQRSGDQTQVSMYVAPRPSERRLVAELANRIAAEPAADLSTTALAAMAGIGVRQLTRVFRAQMGITPGKFVRASRVEAAARLLNDATLPLSAVARRCGFGSGETMRQAFIEYYDTTPSDYRRTKTTAASRAQPGPTPPHIV